MEEGTKNPQAYHLAGIVPVAGPALDFQFPWHDSMQPIAKNYLAVERSVVECAYAGCETIWIICNDDMQPLIKHRLGDYIEDPYYLDKSAFVKHPSQFRRQIPIFYAPIHPKDRDRRDSLGWSVIHGALTAFIISDKISKWMIPSRYYVSFPYGVYQPWEVYKHRKRISNKKPFFVCHNGKTVRDGEYLGFTLDAEEYKTYLTNVKSNCTGGNKGISPDKRWSSRFFTIDKIFDSDIIDKEMLEVSWYHKIDSWEAYHNYMSSEESRLIKCPGKSLLKRTEYNSKVEYENENI